MTSSIARGQVLDMKGDVAKATFRLTSRTNFGSMFQELLSPAEKSRFIAMVGDPKKASDNPILSALEAPINARRAADGHGPVTLTRSTRFFFNSVGTTSPTYGPRIHDWLVDLTKGKDDLSGPGDQRRHGRAEGGDPLRRQGLLPGALRGAGDQRPRRERPARERLGGVRQGDVRVGHGALPRHSRRSADAEGGRVEQD